MPRLVASRRSSEPVIYPGSYGSLPMLQNGVVKQVLEDFKPLWALDYSSDLLEWDLETYMPTDAASPRGFTQAQIALMKQKHLLGLAPLIAKAREQSGLTDTEKGIVRIISRDLDYYTKLPPQLLEDLHRTTTEATVVWREARRKSDFQLFKSHLEKIVDLKRQEAEKLGHVGHPYNALLDRFEEGATTSDVDNVFSTLVPELKKVIDRVLAEDKFPRKHPLESAEYREEDMRRLNEEMLAILGMPKNTFRLDVSTHPFTSGIAIHDVRITTRYEGKSFKDSLFSLIHECGHAIYSLQIDPALEYTPLPRGASLAFHESQSRFWENFIGRSRRFVRLVDPIIRKHLPFVRNYSFEALYGYFNTVKPSLIRVEADELTYNLHIVLRYELEKRLIAGEVAVSEVPSLWNDMMEKYLGLRPSNDAEGALQDVHWSGGGFGYFSTYSLGNVIAGMAYDKIRKEINLEDCLAKGDMRPAKDWLKENIHRWGDTYPSKELQKRLFNETYNSKHLLNYLEEKYLAQSN
jgi:carboxypeptidase Taq